MFLAYKKLQLSLKAMAWTKFKKQILTFDMGCAIHIGMKLMNFIFESMDLGVYVIQADARKKSPTM